MNEAIESDPAGSDAEVRPTEAAGPVAAPESPAGRRWGRWWLLGGAAALSAALVATVLVLGEDESVVEQSICGLERAAGTPLSTLLPPGRPGLGEWAVEPRGDEGRIRWSCQITVDGQEALSISMFEMTGVEPDQPEGDLSLEDLVGRTVVSSSGSSAIEYCSDDRTRVAGSFVYENMDLLPTDRAKQDSHARAMADVAEAVLAGRGRDVCR
ncbi:hypothetical protein PUR61_34815 [Streptomyces sp. BE20]|uniref:hypothetical protein n=1 Tax=unclassified Streptomyces TaxID=2593676 RepID=UPI002E7688E3|nr:MULTISPECIES: hypothetical protein [unclassified Streptomyces]MED7954651.1 hypothetical protein [Streptomyces sp. BE303]MEE1827327.1 hypothetical protein [Streptomyces sp. BE20]